MNEIKVGDEVRVLELTGNDKMYGIEVGQAYEVVGMASFLDAILINVINVKKYLMHGYQIEKVEEIEEMTFPEMAQKLIDGEFEVGTELVTDHNSYFVDKVNWSGNYGLKSDKSGDTIMTTISANVLNATWKAIEEVKEMSIEQLQEELGYKIKIVE